MQNCFCNTEAGTDLAEGPVDYAVQDNCSIEQIDAQGAQAHEVHGGDHRCRY